MRLDATTRPVALLGHPVGHSLSPLIHNTAFAALGLPYVYLALPVREDALEAAVEGLRALGFAGGNVTLPHKEAAARLVDRCSDEAAAVGAVNTVVCREADGGVVLWGDNTDVEGFLAPLEPHGEALQGAEAVVFGAGGAARAAVYALLTRYGLGRLTLAARTPERAEQLAADMAAHDAADVLRVVPMDEAAPTVRRAALVVNATPVGMHPTDEATPWPDAGDFAAGQLVYDLVYAPLRTRLLREAEARGAQPLGGLDMLVAQAAAAFRQWTGCAFPREAVREALRRRLQRAPS